jgi:hypothetical protein
VLREEKTAITALNLHPKEMMQLSKVFHAELML